MGGKGKAFLKGGAGCLVAFLVIGLLVVLIGGRMRLDIGGVILLFVIGGVIGLIVLAIYNRGRKDASIPRDRMPPRFPDDQSNFPSSAPDGR